MSDPGRCDVGHDVAAGLAERADVVSVYSMQLDQVSPANLNDAVEGSIRGLIVDGGLAPGERLNEVHLATALGVSRTPVREALNRLVAEGAVVAKPRFGYFVKPLTLEEFEQLYDIRPLLEPEALRLAGAPSAERIDRLVRINQHLLRAKDDAARIALDDEWHLTLLEGCPNKVLIGIIQNMMLRVRRYELTWMREAGNAAKAGDGHAVILRALGAGRLEDACSALRANLSDAKPDIAAWLGGRRQ